MAVKVKEIIIRYEEDDGAGIAQQAANRLEDFRPLRLDVHHHMAPPPPPDQGRGDNEKDRNGK